MSIRYVQLSADVCLFNTKSHDTPVRMGGLPALPGCLRQDRRCRHNTLHRSLPGNV